MNKRLEHALIRLHELVKNSPRILAAVHERADGDALGALLAFRDLTAGSGREYTLLAPDSNLKLFSYLKGIDDVLTDATRMQPEAHDLVVLLDCGDVKRTFLADKLYSLGRNRPPVVIIDHHPLMPTFRGKTLVDMPIVETKASSTCELVFQYAQANGLKVSPAAATAMLTGIVTDTGGFQNLNTTYESMDFAAELLKSGANLRKIVQATVRSKSIGVLQLWGRALSRLEHDPETGIVSTALTKKDFEECGVDSNSTEGIASFLNTLGEGKVFMVLREEDKGTVKGSLRTKHPHVDVAAMAESYGGGGHKKAAGFTVKGTIVKKEKGWTIETAPGPSPLAARQSVKL